MRHTLEMGVRPRLAARGSSCCRMLATLGRSEGLTVSAWRMIWRSTGGRVLGIWKSPFRICSLASIPKGSLPKQR